MSRWLSLARRPEEIEKPLPDTPTKPDKRYAEAEERDLCPVMSGCRVDKSGEIDADKQDACTVPDITPSIDIPVKDAAPDLPERDDFHRTWTGGVVSLAEWRNLSAWDRYGPVEKLFCGICNQWVVQDAACTQLACWKDGD